MLSCSLSPSETLLVSIPTWVKCYVQGWTGLWATWSSWRCPCLLQGVWARWPLKVPSNPKYSMILWVAPLHVFLMMNMQVNQTLSKAITAWRNCLWNSVASAHCVVITHDCQEFWIQKSWHYKNPTKKQTTKNSLLFLKLQGRSRTLILHAMHWILLCSKSNRSMTLKQFNIKFTW